jgi:hypothetical protein
MYNMHAKDIIISPQLFMTPQKKTGEYIELAASFARE